MKNVIILGSGRSGTSMVAGMLAKAGYYMGDHLYPPRASNAKGFFEDQFVNAVNEHLLELVIPNRPQYIPYHIRKFIFRDRPMMWQRWLARVPVDTFIRSTQDLSEKIRNLTEQQPFCYKDPRFSYTLPVWRPYLDNTVFICIFRDPTATAASIVKECQQMEYLGSLKMDFQIALDVWHLMYRHILEIHRHNGDWLFLHYNQVLNEAGMDKTEIFLNIKIDRDFPDPKLQSPVPSQAISSGANLIYEQLCILAEYDAS